MAERSKKKPPQEVPEYFFSGLRPMPDVAFPEEYAKPLANVLTRFTRMQVKAGAVCCPYAVAVAIAVVIVVWDVTPEEMVVRPDEKAALKFALEQIKANPDMVRKLTGVELTQPHIKLMEALTR
jgi:hypothetical protein